MSKIKWPAKPVCALCGIDEYVETVHLGEGVFQHVCTGPHHNDPRIWEETTSSGVDALALEGLAAEWGLYDDLPRCLVAGEALVEYGIVEHRYRNLNPIRYAALIDRYGHTAIAPSHYTTSSFIAGALGRLWRRGDLHAEFGPATGYWAYNTTVSYWGLPNADTASHLTWEEFADTQGLDPASWSIGA